MNAAASGQLRKEKVYAGLGCPGSRQDERGPCHFTPALWAWDAGSSTLLGATGREKWRSSLPNQI